MGHHLTTQYTIIFFKILLYTGSLLRKLFALGPFCVLYSIFNSMRDLTNLFRDISFIVNSTRHLLKISFLTEKLCSFSLVILRFRPLLLHIHLLPSVGPSTQPQYSLFRTSTVPPNVLRVPRTRFVPDTSLLSLVSLGNLLPKGTGHFPSPNLRPHGESSTIFENVSHPPQPNSVTLLNFFLSSVDDPRNSETL